MLSNYSLPKPGSQKLINYFLTKSEQTNYLDRALVYK